MCLRITTDLHAFWFQHTAGHQKQGHPVHLWLTCPSPFTRLAVPPTQPHPFHLMATCSSSKCLPHIDHESDSCALRVLNRASFTTELSPLKLRTILTKHCHYYSQLTDERATWVVKWLPRLTHLSSDSESSAHTHTQWKQANYHQPRAPSTGLQNRSIRWRKAASVWRPPELLLLEGDSPRAM